MAKNVKIRLIPSKIKIIEPEKSEAESLEGEVEDLETEHFASFVAGGNINPSLRASTSQKEETEELDSQQISTTATTPENRSGGSTRALYQPRSSATYTTGGAVSQDTIYEDPMAAAERSRPITRSAPVLGEGAGRQAILNSQQSETGVENASRIQSREDRNERYEHPSEEREGLQVKRRRDWRM